MPPIDRRSLLCGGCAAFSLAACGDRNFVTDDPGSGTDDTSGPGPDPVLPDYEHPLDNPNYPCDQPVEVDGEGWGGFDVTVRTELQTVGGWIPATKPSGFQYIVAHVEEGCYVAVARRCTHQGALVAYDPGRGQFVCPLHASVFDPDGTVVGGPAPLDLEVFFAGRVGDTVWVRVTD